MAASASSSVPENVRVKMPNSIIKLRRKPGTSMRPPAATEASTASKRQTVARPSEASGFTGSLSRTDLANASS